MKILILGSTGLLGSECATVVGQDHEVIAPDRKKMDIISWDGVIENLREIWRSAPRGLNASWFIFPVITCLTGRR